MIVLAGKEYGSGSSRDWAAKGTALLGVRAVLAESFERIHRSNLIGMGVLPLQYVAGESAETLGLTGREQFDLIGVDTSAPSSSVTVRADGREFRADVRIDTAMELRVLPPWRDPAVRAAVARPLSRSAHQDAERPSPSAVRRRPHRPRRRYQRDLRRGVQSIMQLGRSLRLASPLRTTPPTSLPGWSQPFHTLLTPHTAPRVGHRLQAGSTGIATRHASQSPYVLAGQFGERIVHGLAQPDVVGGDLFPPSVAIVSTRFTSISARLPASTERDSLLQRESGSTRLVPRRSPGRSCPRPALGAVVCGISVTVNVTVPPRRSFC